MKRGGERERKDKERDTQTEHCIPPYYSLMVCIGTAMGRQADRWVGERHSDTLTDG